MHRFDNDGGDDDFIPMLSALLILLSIGVDSLWFFLLLAMLVLHLDRTGGPTM
jgi:hypothetical protein